MANIRVRDRVWSAVLDMAEEKRGKSTWGRRFKAKDVVDAMDDPPSSRTVRETLQSMVELGHLEKGRSKGVYEPLEREESSSTKERKVSSGPSIGESSASTSWSPSVDTSTASSSGDRMSASDAALALEDDASDEEPQEAAQEAASVDVDSLDLPGTDDVLEARRAAVKACYEYLRDEGEATKTDFEENVYPDHPASYESSRSWWHRVGLEGLRALADDRDDIEAPVPGGRTWRYTG